MENNKNDEVEIDLMELLQSLLKHWKFILVVFLAIVAISAGCTMFFIPKQYESRISMYVNNSSKDNGYINSADLTASRNLVSTYMELITSDCVMDKVFAKVNFENYDAKVPANVTKLRKLISCQQLKDTEIFEVRVKTTDAELSAEIAKTIGEVAPKEISRVFKSGSVEIIDKAKVPTKHVSPSIQKNTILGGLLGIIISCGIVVLASILNQKVTGSKDLENKYNLPVLGVIPDRLEK